MLPVYSSELATGKSKPNNLFQHASPYLAMHGKDPVQWREWNAETIALAKKENKLLFVSSGYFFLSLVSCNAKRKLPEHGRR